MRILFLSHYFSPEVNAPASRTFEHCREWVNSGDDVTVVTCAPNHPTGQVYPEYRNRWWHRSTIDGIHVIRVRTYLAANRGVVRRSLSHVSYMISVLLVAPLLPRADCVVSTSPQFFCGLTGYFVSRLKRVPWVLEIRDLWPAAIVELGAIKNKVAIRLLEKIERWAYKRADRIVVVTQGFRQYMIGRGVAAEKISVVTNGADLTLFRGKRDHAELRRVLGTADKFVAGYLGTIGMAHHLETILETAALLRDDKNVMFLVVGDGAERERIHRLWQERGLKNVLMLGQQPREAMPSFWSICDACLALRRKGAVFSSMIPAKIFEAMAMACPVILAGVGESRNLISHAGCGICIEPENPQELAGAVRQLAGARELCWKMGMRGRCVAEERYDRAKLAAKFRLIVHEAATPGGDHMTSDERRPGYRRRPARRYW